MNTYKPLWVVLVFIHLFLVCEFAPAQTNVYHPFPDSNAVWRIYAFDGNSQSYYMYDYVMSGDTLIGSYKYKKIQRDIGYLSFYIGALREDISSKKVYFYPSASTTENLIYDFNADKTGDTACCCEGYQVVVYSIDSILINNQYRKKINYYSLGGSSGILLSFIEGIGKTSGLIEPCGNDGTLICFRQNDTTLYINPMFQNACGTVNVMEEDNKRNVITIYPNPSSGIFLLEIQSQYYEREENLIIIYNVLGEMIYQKSIDTNKTIIDISSFSKGLYFMEITDDFKNKKYIKLIIQ